MTVEHIPREYVTTSCVNNLQPYHMALTPIIIFVNTQEVCLVYYLDAITMEMVYTPTVYIYVS